MAPILKTIALLPVLFSAIASAVRPVEVQGRDFVDAKTNKRLQIVGVDYQPGGQSGYKPNERKDPLTDGKVCMRDAALLQRLGVNTVRVYNVDPTLNHDECASIFNTAGIYMIIDVNSPFESLHRDNPGPSYTADYVGRVFGVVENFKSYPNTLAFFSANEVMNDVDSSKDTPPYVRAVTRDLKNYIAKQSSRKIPVGYSAADVRDILEDTWAYFQCAIDGKDDDASRSDFFGLNSYSWCGGEATFASAGYDTLVDMFQDTTIPVFFSEFGCNKVQPRVFNEVQALYGDKMTGLTGGLVYEYSQEDADYGLVQINDNGTVTLLTDYDNLQKSYNKLDTKKIQSLDATSANITIPKCDKELISTSGFSTNFTVPAQPKGVSDWIKNGANEIYVRGKLVEIKNLTVEQEVYGTTGFKVSNLAVTAVTNDDSNIPGGDTTTPTTGEAATPSESKEGSATAKGKDAGTEPVPTTPDFNKLKGDAATIESDKSLALLVAGVAVALGWG